MREISDMNAGCYCGLYEDLKNCKNHCIERGENAREGPHVDSEDSLIFSEVAILIHSRT